MARMLYYVSLKFEGCPVPDIRSTSGEIRSSRDKKVRLTAVSNFAERHVLRARRRVSHTRAADAHVHAAELTARVSGCIIPACSTTAGVPLLHYGRSGSSENGCRDRVEGISRFVSLKNHAGETRARDSERSSSQSVFRRIYESAQRKFVRMNRLIFRKIRWRINWVARKVKIITLSGE